MDTRKLSIVIPVFNEEDDVLRSLEQLQAYLDGLKLNYEVVVVNDGSTDNTENLLKEYSASRSNIIVVSYMPNRGKGFAIKTGMLKAAGDIRLFFDVDLSVPLETIEVFIKEMENKKYDVLVGTRKNKDARILKRQPIFREYMGKGYTHLTNLLLGTSYSDFTCGFKAFRKHAAEAIFSKQSITGWSFDAEILLLVKRLKFTSGELSVTWRNSEDTRVRLLRDTVRSFWELLKIKYKYSFAQRPGK